MPQIHFSTSNYQLLTIFNDAVTHANMDGRGEPSCVNEPSTLSNALYPIEKWPKDKMLNSENRFLLKNVFNYIRHENPSFSAEDAAHIASEMTGVGWPSIYYSHKHQLPATTQTTKESKNKGEPGKGHVGGFGKPVRPGKDKRLQVYHQFTLSAIRNAIHTFFKHNQIPTVKKLLHAINDEPTLPNFKKSTLDNIIKDLGFHYVKLNRKSVLIERGEVVNGRRDYLRIMRKHRADARHIIYLDETWINTGHAKPPKPPKTPANKAPKPLAVAVAAAAVPGALPADPAKPVVPKESGLIVIHAGSARGFVPGACHIFQAERNATDYHEEMEGTYFERWFTTQLLPYIPHHSVIVMDNAPYHSVKTERLPNGSWRKADVRIWLQNKGIPWAEDMLKSELLLMVKNVKHIYSVNKIDVIARQAGHVVVRQPPYHCELNPMEQAWNLVKGWVAAENKTFKNQDVKNLTLTSLSRITPDEWAKFVQHVIDRENMMWDTDGNCDNLVDKVLANTDIDSGTETSEGESDGYGSGMDLI